jgi:hypothetical protein
MIQHDFTTEQWKPTCGVYSKHPKISKISCFSTHTVSPPAWLYQGLSLMGHGGSPHISHPGNSEVSSFQERPRLLAAAEDPEVPPLPFELDEWDEWGYKPWDFRGPTLKIDGKMLGHLPWDVGCFCIHLGSYNHLRMVARSIFCRFRRCLNEIWLDLTFLSAFLIAQTCRWLFANSYRLPTKMQVTDLSGQPLF